jgi:hypothetical protein
MARSPVKVNRARLPGFLPLAKNNDFENLYKHYTGCIPIPGSLDKSADGGMGQYAPSISCCRT